jgi:hypothetical protein
MMSEVSAKQHKQIKEAAKALSTHELGVLLVASCCDDKPHMMRRGFEALLSAAEDTRRVRAIMLMKDEDEATFDVDKIDVSEIDRADVREALELLVEFYGSKLLADGMRELVK